MTQEEKDLLLKDLCARLPYGVKGLVTFNGNPSTPQIQEDRTIDGKLYDRFAEFQDSWYDNVTIKPYLFPLSSMTDEQKEEFNTQSLELQLKVIDDEIMYEKATEFEVDFYNKHHLDWRGLIPMGLAIDATNLNIY